MGIMMLGEEYVPLAIHSLGGIQCALYCHRNVLGDVEMISLADVTCGVGNVFHNKGAIGVYLKMKRHDTENDVTKSTRFLFVTGHLAAHVKNVDARNSDFKRIMSELEAQAPIRFLRPKRNDDGTLAECDGSNLLNSMDHVYFAGDLNYRIDLPREEVERCIIDIRRRRSEADACNTAIANSGNCDLMKKLLRWDQLLQAITSGQAFTGFNEGRIAFLPTFKFDKGTSNYDTSHKQRVPAWTDRIVFRSKKVRVVEYQSVDDAKHSDHRPVFGTFQLGWGLKEKMIERRTKRTRHKGENPDRVRKGT
jgi:phosphatidylinositol-bisphosphatase